MMISRIDFLALIYRDGGSSIQVGFFLFDLMSQCQELIPAEL